jgi:ATP-dependent DNA helicase RecQ
VHPKSGLKPRKKVLLALKAVVQTEQRFGMDHLVAVLTGIKDQYVESYGHDQLEVYGKGSEQDAQFWNSVVRQILLSGFWKKISKILGY